MRFTVTLPDEFRLLEGVGVVLWAREEEVGSGQPAGMALRFASLGPRSQELIDSDVLDVRNIGPLVAIIAVGVCIGFLPHNFNPARIWKLYGTLAAKGDPTPERPHRLSRLVEGA